MAEEEFQESEVVFSDASDRNNRHRHSEVSENYFSYRDLNSHALRSKPSSKKSKKKDMANSLPVNIPHGMFQLTDSDEEFDDGEMIPPHLIVSRRVAGKMTSFSVCTGNGRTLKGRDLSRVRNSILRMTGFLETGFSS